MVVVVGCQKKSSFERRMLPSQMGACSIPHLLGKDSPQGPALRTHSSEEGRRPYDVRLGVRLAADSVVGLYFCFFEKLRY